MKQEPMAYIGRHPACGHIVLAVVDSPDRRDETAAEIASAIRQGLSIERMTCSAVRASANTEWCPEDCERLAREST